MEDSKRGRCACCGKECSITADGVIRFHVAPDNAPECKEGPDSRKCKGAGTRPKGYKAPEVEPGTAGHVCRVCGHPVELTANKRARSHLNLDNPPVRCGGGSDWPLAVAPDGTRTDTAPQAEQGFTMGHTIDDGAGGHWTHPGAAADCPMPECLQARCTHPGGFVWGDDDNGHSGSVCMECGMDEDDLTETEAMERRGQQVGTAVAAMDARDALAGETFPTGAEHDPDTGVPSSALVAALEREVGDPGTVADRLVAGAAYGRNSLAEAAEAVAAADRMRSHLKVADLMVGTIFQRHTSKTPELIYRVKTLADLRPGWVATVVTPGPYAGREGTLTNLEEVVRCTDLNGRPRPRPQQPPQPSSPEAASPSPTTAPAPGSRPTTPAAAPAATTTTSSPETSSAPTAAAATNTRTAPVTDSATQFLAGASGAHGEDEGRYDRYGRYMLLHPVTGEPVNWTRATTFAKSISDTYALSMWSQRMVLKGATRRPDLIVTAAMKDVAADKEWMDNATAELKNMAGDKVAANLGTAYHSFTELCDRAADPYAELVRVVPVEAQPDIRAYLDLLSEVGLRPVPTLIEFTTGVLQYEVMGTSDRCYQVTKHLELHIPGKVIHLSPGEFVIGDVKTGKDLDYDWGEIAIQLATYANGINTCGRWDWGTRTWDPTPLAQYAEPGTKVRLDVGIVPHIPVDKSKGKTPALYAVDLDSGWSAAVLCERVRSWRKYKKLAGPVRVLGPGARVLQQEAAQQPAAVPAAAPAASAPAQPAATREPTLMDLADAVTTRAEASQVFQRAKAAAVEEKITPAELEKIVEHMQARLKVLAEPGG